MPHPTRRTRPIGALHQLAAVLTMASAAPRQLGQAAWQRRQRQRLAIAQRLLDPLPQGLRQPQPGRHFWVGLRGAGAGLILAWWLQR
ncbi:hypothetical protein [Synechococcus sp. CS-1328]|uniref:hypothetical protein n=1 Tax=Synechococcus sp. CS-1328 TaxID=2847976 RepID=UPI00223C0C73|nr:hypothetical protein [Synechococcus sp. CS-1328]MCT0226259.1 hypothetical protein [Synechococcus sp. CS-1328]